MSVFLEPYRYIGLREDAMGMQQDKGTLGAIGLSNGNSYEVP